MFNKKKINQNLNPNVVPNLNLLLLSSKLSERPQSIQPKQEAITYNWYGSLPNSYRESYYSSRKKKKNSDSFTNQSNSQAQKRNILSSKNQSILNHSQQINNDEKYQHNNNNNNNNNLSQNKHLFVSKFKTPFYNNPLYQRKITTAIKQKRLSEGGIQNNEINNSSLSNYFQEIKNSPDENINLAVKYIGVYNDQIGVLSKKQPIKKRDRNQSFQTQRNTINIINNYHSHNISLDQQQSPFSNAQQDNDHYNQLFLQSKYQTLNNLQQKQKPVNNNHNNQSYISDISEKVATNHQTNFNSEIHHDLQKQKQSQQEAIQEFYQNSVQMFTNKNLFEKLNSDKQSLIIKNNINYLDLSNSANTIIKQRPDSSLNVFNNRENLKKLSQTQNNNNFQNQNFSISHQNSYPYNIQTVQNGSLTQDLETQCLEPNPGKYNVYLVNQYSIPKKLIPVKKLKKTYYEKKFEHLSTKWQKQKTLFNKKEDLL